MSKCNGIVACCKKLTHMAHLIKLRFCVWCAKCAKYLAFGTSAVDAFKILNVFLKKLENLLIK